MSAPYGSPSDTARLAQEWKTESITDRILKAIDHENRKQFVAAIGGEKYEVLTQLKPIIESN